MTKQKNHKKQKGFSLFEITASITIMAILAGTGVISAVNQINSAKIIATMDEMKSISQALVVYHNDHPGDTVSTITTLVTQKYLTKGFTSAPQTSLKTDWKKDAWGKEYRFTAPSVDAKGVYLEGQLTSAGADGVFDDNPATTIHEDDDNITIVIEPKLTSV